MHIILYFEQALFSLEWSTYSIICKLFHRVERNLQVEVFSNDDCKIHCRQMLTNISCTIKVNYCLWYYDVVNFITLNKYCTQLFLLKQQYPYNLLSYMLLMVFTHYWLDSCYVRVIKDTRLIQILFTPMYQLVVLNSELVTLVFGGIGNVQSGLFCSILITHIFLWLYCFHFSLLLVFLLLFAF